MSGLARFLPMVVLGLGVLLASSFVGSGEAWAEEGAGAGAEYAAVGAEECLECHDEPPVTLITRTPHAQRADPRTPFSAKDCETCHGPSAAHMERPAEGEERKPVAVQFGRFSPTPVAEQNAQCLECHESGLRMNWRGSPHHFADVPCASCHTVHSLKDPVLVKRTQPDQCFDCHAEKRAQSNRFSHHPVREGKMACTDCHNPHGSMGPSQLVKATVNQTCYQCHTEKRGPFLWEHAPVREDCTNCHQPHGATQPSMLKVRTPWLCQQCHLADFHPSTAYSGTGIPPLGAVRQLLSKGCLNCHSKVHGSNHPSGVRFMR